MVVADAGWGCQRRAERSGYDHRGSSSKLQSGSMGSKTPLRRGGGLRIAFEMISAGSGFHPGAGGMITYYDGLLRGLCALADVDSVVVFVSPWNRSLAVPTDPKIEVVTCRGLTRGRIGRVAYEQAVLPILAARHHVEVLMCTVNVMPLLRRAPTVVVLQSIQHHMWPEQVGRLRSAYLGYVIPRSLRRAEFVIAVTDTERADVLRLFPIDPERIVTVYHGVPRWARMVVEASSPPAPHRLPDGAPYVLAISRLYTHKNHRRLIEAFALLLKWERLPHHLLVVGGDADVRRAELEELSQQLGIADRVHCLGQMPQDEIPGLFAGATAMAYVSLYETFGLPVIETFELGLPLVTSDVGATAEVAGAGARLVDPSNVENIAGGLRDVLLDETYRQRLAEAGRRRAAEFTWERCAHETLAVLMLAAAQDSNFRHDSIRDLPENGSLVSVIRQRLRSWAER